MKNYLVKANFKFNDMEEKTADGTDTVREQGAIFNCTKERYEYLKSKDAVTLMGIEEVKEPEVVVEEPVEKNVEVSKPKKQIIAKKKSKK